MLHGLSRPSCFVRCVLARLLPMLLVLLSVREDWRAYLELLLHGRILFLHSIYHGSSLDSVVTFEIVMRVILGGNKEAITTKKHVVRAKSSY